MLQDIKKSLAPYYERFFSSWPGGFSPFPTNVMFELLYGCNLNCSFCYLRVEETVRKIKARRMMLTAEILKAIDQIPRQTALSFSGGEIMLHKDIIKILTHAKKHHRVGIISNLTVNTPWQNQQLVNLGIDTIMTSLDSHDPMIHDRGRGKKGSFQKTVNTIKDLQKQKQLQGRSTPTITINSMILPQTYQYMSQVVETAAKLKPNWLTFQLLDPSLNRSGYNLHENLQHLTSGQLRPIPKIDPELLALSLNQALTTAEKLKLKVSFSPQLTPQQVVDYYSGRLDLTKIYCHRIFHLTRISPFGDLYPCFNLKIGSVLDTHFSKLWNNSRYRQFRSQIKAGGFKAHCLGCCHLRLKD